MQTQLRDYFNHFDFFCPIATGILVSTHVVTLRKYIIIHIQRIQISTKDERQSYKNIWLNVIFGVLIYANFLPD